MPLIHRLVRRDAAVLNFMVDGTQYEGREGDTLLTAILSNGDALRLSDFTGEPRAGFCQMGACQDCLVALESGERLRACTTPLRDGLRLVTLSGLVG